MRLIRLLPWMLLIALVAFSVGSYASLPPLVPQHMDLSGRVTATVPRSPASWGLLPFIALLMQLLFEVIRRRLPRRPELFNFSAKDDFLKLPAEFRPPIVARMQAFLDVAAAITMLVMLGVQVMLWYAARGGNGGIATILLLLSGVVVTPLLFVVQQGVVNEVERAKRVWESRRNPLAR